MNRRGIVKRLMTLVLCLAPIGVVSGQELTPNANGCSNPKVDKIVEKLAIETVPAERKKIAADFSRMVVKDALILPLIEIQSVTVASSDVKNHSKSANFTNET